MNEEFVRYIVETIEAKSERTIKRLWILCIVAFTSLVITNILWIQYEGSWKYVETQQVEQSVSNNEGSTVINDGVHIDGDSNSASYTN